MTHRRVGNTVSLVNNEVVKNFNNLYDYSGKWVQFLIQDTKLTTEFKAYSCLQKSKGKIIKKIIDFDYANLCDWLNMKGRKKTFY